LLVCAALLPIGGVAFVLDGLLLGASRYEVLQRVMLTSLLGFAPMAIATGLDHRLGIVGVWLALLCWMSLRTAILLRWWLSGRWERPG
jgi:Na+-driven multidrug efflux pump